MTTSPSGILLCIVLLASQTFAWRPTDIAVTNRSNAASLAVADSDRSPSARIIARDATPEPSVAAVEDFASVMFSDNTIDFIPESDTRVTAKSSEPIAAEPIDPTEYLESIGAIESIASIKAAAMGNSAQSMDALAAAAPFEVARLVGPVQSPLSLSPASIDSPAPVSLKLASLQDAAAEPKGSADDGEYGGSKERYIYEGYWGDYHLTPGYAMVHYRYCGRHFLIALQRIRGGSSEYFYYSSLEPSLAGQLWAFAKCSHCGYYKVWRQRNQNSKFCEFDWAWCRQHAVLPYCP